MFLMKYPLLILLVFSFIYSCSLKTKEEEKIIIIPKIQSHPQEEIHSYLAKNINEILKENTFFNKDWIEKFYQKNNYKAVWVNDSLHLNTLGDSLLSIFDHANYYGLDSKDYKSGELKKLIKRLKKVNSTDKMYKEATLLELFLSDNYMLFGKHLNFGKIENVDSLTTIKRKLFTVDLPKYYASAFEKDSVIDYLLDLQPQHEGYKNTQNALRVFLKKASLSKKIIKVINYKEDSLKAYKQAKKSLVNHRYILKKSSDSVFINGLKKFQTDHGLTSDGVVGKNTAMALSISPFEYYQNAAISLERWRWKKVWKPTFIYVNIPAYFIKYYKNDTLQFRSNVVVGTVRNKTPEVYGKLNHLVAYPYWNVPTSISVNEILVNAKKDTAYMERNNYEVFSNKFKEISLDSIKWDTIHKKNFHYYIRQRGGTSNALGLVKFIFDNKYSIYLHDTPTKYYFYRDIRAYSHGCIRVQKALQLADTLLISDKNKFTLDSVFAYIDKKEEKKMIFTKKLPLYIQYITCTSDKNNRLIFYKDIYGYDEKVRKILFK